MSTDIDNYTDIMIIKIDYSKQFFSMLKHKNFIDTL